jgi:hypothetical protein
MAMWDYAEPCHLLSYVDDHVPPDTSPILVQPDQARHYEAQWICHAEPSGRTASPGLTLCPFYNAKLARLAH